MNILHEDVYGYWHNNNKKEGKAAHSWCRARYQKNDFTPLRKCPSCGLRKTPQKYGNQPMGPCFSCKNKSRAIWLKAARFILSQDSKDSGLSKPIRIMLYLVDEIDDMSYFYNAKIDEALVESGVHLSVHEQDDVFFALTKRRNSWFGRRESYIESALSLLKDRKIGKYSVSRLENEIL